MDLVGLLYDKNNSFYIMSRNRFLDFVLLHNVREVGRALVHRMFTAQCERGR